MRIVDFLEVPLACGARLSLLILLNHTHDRCAPGRRIGADDVARMLLREWHRETVPANARD